MSTASIELSQFLDTLAKAARPGDRVPAVRDLMRQFSVSQSVVQRVLAGLKSQGLIDAQVGRGTFFRSDGEALVAAADMAATVRSILLLRHSVSIVRGRVVVDGLQRRFAAEGHRVLEVSYTDPEHARTVLRGLPRFDACVIQSSFGSITIETLAALRQKTDVVAVDGLALVGTDVDSVGLEWGEPLAMAVQLLLERGHRRIAHATTSHQFLANELGRRRLDQLRSTHAGVAFRSISVPRLPQEDFEGALAQILKASLDESGHLPFTALVAWGIENGARFRALLADIGLAIPARLSVILLGRADLVNEHANFFDTVGGNAADQIDCLYEAISARWADPSLAYGVRFLPVAVRGGASIGVPPEEARRPTPAAGSKVATRRRAEA